MSRVPLLRFTLLLAVGMVAAPGCRAAFRTGLEVLESRDFASLRGKNVAVVTNPTGSNRSLRSIVDVVAEAPGVRLKAVFGPEHGVRGSAQAGEKVGDDTDPRSGVPVYSLYGAQRRPSRKQLEGLDVILFDIQDIGVRTYTYLATLVEVLTAAAESGIEVWVLDRPVPIGADRVEGPLLEPGAESFVGPHTIPMRHGLTAGEFARMVNDERSIGARVRIVRMEGYRRDMDFAETGLAWIAPSPNIPTVTTALIYAGAVLVEGTNLSEGRGTTRPFHLVGAPWLDGERLARDLNQRRPKGVLFRPTRFTPAASKYAGSEIGGVEMHVVDSRSFRPVSTAVTLIAAVRRLHPEEFEFRSAFFDRLAGGDTLRRLLEAGTPVEEIVATWAGPLGKYLERRQRYLLYR